MRKYRNRPTMLDGIRFDSKAEARRYAELKLLERAGVISGLRLQPRYTILDKYTNGARQRIRAITYVADFEYKEAGKTVVEDVKSPASRTQAYRLKKKMFEKRYYPQTITEVE